MLKVHYKEFAKIVVITVFFLIIGTFIAAYISYLLKEQQVKADAQRLQELLPNILEGAKTGPTKITIDFSSNSISGSPLIFGGSHSPKAEDTDAWNQIEEVGITSIRKDLFPDKVVPQTNIHNYKNNVNGVADPKNWNEVEINKVKDAFINAQNRNMKTIGILAYTPKWLTHNGKDNGVPQDWEVFEDIAKKIYRIHRDNIDYMEIWNEPDWQVFLDIQNSGMTREEVYENMFYYGAKAIREVDKEINDGKIVPIGGPTASDTEQGELLESIIISPRSKQYLDFVSYHNYELKEGRSFPEPSWNNYKEVLNENNIDRPIFITEWNYTADSTKPTEENTGPKGILFTANKFVDYFKMGLTGANYHVIEPLWSSKGNGGEGYFGFYKWSNNKAELVPQARSWRILSRQMDLGTGTSKIFNVDGIDENNIELNSIGFVNNKGQIGAVFVNETTNAQPIQITLNNTNIGSYANVQIYKASIDEEAKKPIYEGLMKIDKNNRISFKYYIPEESVIGIKMTGEREWYEKIPLPFDN